MYGTHKTMTYTALLSIIFFQLSQINSVSTSSAPCVVKGQINTHLLWYGYLLQKTLHTKAKIEYQISYPERECCVKMLILFDDQLKKLSESMSCEQRNAVLPDQNNQIITLSIQNNTKGCERYPASSGEPLIVCTGERTLKSSGPRTWYIAISRCDSDSSKPLDMSYYFNVSNYFGVCEADPLSNTHIPIRVDSGHSTSVVIALGVVSGISTITAIVFGLLFFFGRRRNQAKKKPGSVTSSQATMTQDIFYVNPSLSDREQSDSQYSHSQSSGSENYYEVIPDRRSYESINTQLAMQGQSLRGMHLAHNREHRPNIPPYILEDYPPPPYQSLQNGVHHRQSSANAILQGQSQTNAQTGTGNIQLLHGHMIANGRPVHMNPGIHYNSTNIVGPNRSEQMHPKQIPIGNQSLRFYSHQQRSEQNEGPQRPSSSQGNQTLPSTSQQMNDNGQQTTPKPQANGSVTNQNFVRQQMTNGGPKISNGVAGAQNIQLQTYSQNQNQQQTQNIPNGRQNIPNGNVAKLLHDAYRIQQFETTA